MNEKIEIQRKLKTVPPEKRQRKFDGGMVEKKTALGITYDVFLTIFMVTVILVCVVPMWDVLMSSVSDGKTLMATQNIAWWPMGVEDGVFNWGGYELLSQNSDIWTGYLNTLIYVVFATLLGFALNVIGGYVLSRKTIFERPLAFIVMFTMMFNGGLIPTYMVIRALGMVGTRMALIIPGCTNGIFMLIMSNAFRDVPESTVEAAQIDCAGHLTTMFKIMLPQAMSMATVIILNSVIIQWNSWYSASIYIPTKRDLWPLQLWIKEIIAQTGNFMQAANPNYNQYLLQYCVIVIATAPILMAFPLFLKYIEKGVIVGGVKE